MFQDSLEALVVDDNEKCASLTARKLEQEAEHVSTEYVTSPEDALDVFDRENYDTVVVDYKMPGIDGLEFTEKLDRRTNVPVILYTGKGSENIAKEAFRAGAEDYVSKTSENHLEELSRRVENAALGYRAEEELGVFREAVESSGHAIKITDKSGQLLYVNPAFEENTGYSQEEVLGENPSILKSGEQGKEFYNEMWTTVLSGDVWEGEMVNEDKQGEEYWVKQTISPVKDEQGDIRYFVAVNNDITEEKEKQKFREVVNSILRHDAANNQQLMRSRVEMTHERLRRIDEEQLPEEQQEIYGEVLENVNRLSDLVEDNVNLVRDVRQVLGDFGDLSPEPVDLEEQVDDAVGEAMRLADSRGSEIRKDVDDHTVAGGPLMNRMIYNPIENSIVHPEDSSEVRIRSEEVDGPEGDVLLRISDDGEGFPEEFSWDKGVAGEDSEGSGMGAWLSKEIAETYGIEVEAGESEEGGAEYRFFMEEWED
ncbi:MAG: PAS domain S-box protein [Candidatus Nanosalina sp.]